MSPSVASRGMRFAFKADFLFWQIVKVTKSSEQVSDIESVYIQWAIDVVNKMSIGISLNVCWNTSFAS